MGDVNDFESLVSELRSAYRGQGLAAQSGNLMKIYRWYFDGRINFDTRCALVKENDHLLAKYVHGEIG